MNPFQSSLAGLSYQFGEFCSLRSRLECRWGTIPLATREGQVEACRFFWLVRNGQGGIEFVARGYSLIRAPSFPVLQLILHTRAPSFMPDHHCDAVGGYACLHVPSPKAGMRLFEAWTSEGESAIWRLLEEFHAEAFAKEKLFGAERQNMDERARALL